MSDAVKLVDVSRTYNPTVSPVHALRPCSLTIQPGSYTSIVGPSGSGKSTLLNMIGLLDKPSTGQVWLDGVDTASLSRSEYITFRSEQIGFVFQAFHLIKGRTVVENVALALLYAGVPAEERNTRAAKICESLGLGPRLESDTSLLSGGERQRVAVARALVTEPSVVLCDEPTGNLDQKSGQAVLDQLRRLHREGMTIIVVTHDSDVAAHADQTVKLSDGYVDNRATVVAATQ